MKLELPGDAGGKAARSRSSHSLRSTQERIEEVATYVDWLGPTLPPAGAGGFCRWLATNGKTEEAVTVLQQAIARDPLVTGNTLPAMSLQRLGRKALARRLHPRAAR